MTSIASQTCTATEEAEIQQWLTTSDRLKSSASSSDEQTSILDTLNNHLASRTTLLGSKPSKADVAIYESLSPAVAKWSAEERSGEKGHPHIVRHLDFVQNSTLFGLALADGQKFAVDQDDVRYVKPPIDAKAEKERLKKEKAAAAAAAAAAPASGEQNKDASLVDRTKEKVKETVDAIKDATAAGGAKAGKQRKEKAPKQQKAPAAAAAAATLSPCLIDLRVGHILKAVNHPDADSLYVSTIAMGDPAGSSEDYVEYEGQVCRTVCSGLNGLIPLAQMQGRKVVVVCNLKPVKMRGIKSCAMVLAASPKPKPSSEGAEAEGGGGAHDDKGPVELVAPPEGARAGERVFFEGWAGQPEAVLNPKKKIWETFQPGFTTTDSLDVVFDAAVVPQLGKTDVGRLVTESGGVCTVQTLKGAAVR
ncbi:multisynthetase complex auxiliary component p43 [Moelleriella libera RCEF 2490]|uniref:Multisynthetase complex auxiliary component p43 n=1 Tax=Moelleriella libera RCEF 2490 TaxID=1081109 RepID=A0A168BFZ0_9HYPO|nr:multisynthetase complex auxiliary component p43 [Moelleriella libera RCEF 2490]